MARDFAVVVVSVAARRSAATEAVRLAGGHVAAALDWSACDRLSTAIDADPAAILSIEAEGADDALLERALPRIAAAIEDGGVPAVVTLDPGQIDIVSAALLGLAELLCEPSLGRQAAAIAVAASRAGGVGLSDRVREDEAAREDEISAEIARIADLLARHADRERGGGGAGVGDRRQSFGFEPAAAAVDAPTVRQVIRARRMRDAFFGEQLFEDPVWDMLLDLYAAYLERQRVSVSSLCIAAAVAPTTALRWIGRMTAAGLLERRPDASDRRRAFIGLSPRALAGMEAYAVALRRAGLPFA